MFRQKSVFFSRPYKGKGSKAWEILCKMFKSAERPRREKMFVSIILKGLPKEFNTFCTLVKFRKDDKSLNEIKKIC